MRDTRESGEMLQAALAAGVSAAGGDALLGGVLPTPAAPLLLAPLRLRPRGGALGLAQPLPRQRHQVLRRRRLQAHRRGRGRDRARARAAPPRPRSPARPPQRDAGDRAHPRAARRRRGLPARAAHALPRARPQRARRAARLRQRRHPPRRAGDLQAPRRARARCSPTRPTGATSTPAAAPRTSRRSPSASSRAATRSASPSTATATACSPSDRRGAVVDGDELMALAALHLHARGRLRGDGVAVTVMTNYGFHAAMEQARASTWRPPRVGDRYVLEELRARGWTLGGEQSGHIIDMRFNRTGDGIASALLTLEALGGRDLSERARDGQAAPAPRQRARARPRRARAAPRELSEAVAQRRAQLSGRGRVLVRPSGTEPLVRVMVEAPTERGGRGGLRAARRARGARARLSCARRRPLQQPLVSSLAMCGIVGYVGARPVEELLLAGLGKLEYRGYDSAGISVIADDRIEAVRSVGNLSALRAKLEREPPSGAGRRGRGRRAAGQHRHRPHALGHARARQRGERPPALRQRRPRARGRQRHRRELHGAQAAPAREGRACSPPRPTPR